MQMPKIEPITRMPADVPDYTTCLDFETIGKSMQCGWIHNAGIVVRDDEVLKWMWDRFYAFSLHPPPLPELDFEKIMWICVFRGQYRTWGYSTEIQRIKEVNDAHHTFLRVHVLDLNPRRGDFVKLEFSQPFHIVELERSEREVHFMRRERIRRR